jgi:hypothetical protein
MSIYLILSSQNSQMRWGLVFNCQMNMKKPQVCQVKSVIQLIQQLLQLITGTIRLADLSFFVLFYFILFFGSIGD